MIHSVYFLTDVASVTNQPLLLLQFFISIFHGMINPQYKDRNKLRTSKPVIYSRRCSIRKLDHLVSSSTAIRLLLFLISNYNLISVNWFLYSYTMVTGRVEKPCSLASDYFYIIMFMKRKRIILMPVIRVRPGVSCKGDPVTI